MTGFMTLPATPQTQHSHPGPLRAKDIVFQAACNLCRENHRTQVWLCFVVLSLMSTWTCAASMKNPKDVHNCLSKVEHILKDSDAMLYTPEVDEKCKITSLSCYMLELIMVINEEELEIGDEEKKEDVQKKLDCIHDFHETLEMFAGCPPCEAYSLKNITVFLKRLHDLLEEVTAQWNGT